MATATTAYIPYPYRSETVEEGKPPQAFVDYQRYIGQSTEVTAHFDPPQNKNSIDKASKLARLILSWVKKLEQIEQKGGWRRIVSPVRAVLAWMPGVRRLHSAQKWATISQSIQAQDWSQAIDTLHSLNKSPHKLKVIEFPYASFEAFRADKTISLRTNLVDFEKHAAGTSWVHKNYYCDMVMCVYVSLLATAYFNRALAASVDTGIITPEARKDINRAKVYAQMSGRGMQTQTWQAIQALEGGMLVQRRAAI